MTTILLIGPGAIGSLIGWHLQDSITIKVHPHREAMDLPVSVESNDASYPLTWVLADNLKDIDAVLVCCKSTQVASATRPLIPLLAECPWVILCNGMGPQAWLSEQLPGRVLWASTTEGAGRFGSVVRRTGHGETCLGMPSAYPVCHETEQFGYWLAKQKGHLAVKWEPDITSMLWRKLAINAVINPITAMLHARNGELTESRWQHEIVTLCSEISSIATACNVRLPTDLPALIVHVAAATRENQSSMLVDVCAGRITEIDTIVGPLLHAADRHSLPAPRLQYWYQAVINQYPLNR